MRCRCLRAASASVGAGCGGLRGHACVLPEPLVWLVPITLGAPDQTDECTICTTRRGGRSVPAMGASYGQFCPVSKAMELLDERWTLLVVRELMLGSEHFNQLRRGLPRMSPTLLSRRLQQLARAGVVDARGGRGRGALPAHRGGRGAAAGRGGARRRGAPAGSPTWPIPTSIPKLLLWDMHRNVDHERVPPRRRSWRSSSPTSRPGVARWWLVLTADDVDVCDDDPGDEPVARVQTSLRTLTEVWRGDRSWASALGRRVDAGAGHGRGRRRAAGLVPAVALRRGAATGAAGRPGRSLGWLA